MIYGFREQHYPPFQGASLKTLLILFLIHLQNSRILYNFQSWLTLSHTAPFSTKHTGEKVVKGRNIFTVVKWITVTAIIENKVENSQKLKL